MRPGIIAQIRLWKRTGWLSGQTLDIDATHPDSLRPSREPLPAMPTSPLPALMSLGDIIRAAVESYSLLPEHLDGRAVADVAASLKFIDHFEEQFRER